MIIEETRAPLQPIGDDRDARPVTTRSAAHAPAAMVATAPVLMLGALAYHPYIPKLNNDASVAAELTADTTRWGLSHLAVGVAAALLLLALLALAGHLRAAGEVTATTLATPFLVIGSVLFAFLPAMEIAMLAVHEAGGDVYRILPELTHWFVPILVASSAAFAVGVVLLAVAIVRSRMLDPGLARFVAAALLVMAAARFVPLGGALYVTGVAGVAALWPLAHRMWQSPAESAC